MTELQAWILLGELGFLSLAFLVIILGLRT
jgi:hypothetical protein